MKERLPQRLFLIPSHYHSSFLWLFFMLFPFPGTFLPDPPSTHTAWLSLLISWSSLHVTLLEVFSSPPPSVGWGCSSGSHTVCLGAPRCAVHHTPGVRLLVSGEQDALRGSSSCNSSVHILKILKPRMVFHLASSIYWQNLTAAIQLRARSPHGQRSGWGQWHQGDLSGCSGYTYRLGLGVGSSLWEGPAENLAEPPSQE